MCKMKDYILSATTDTVTVGGARRKFSKSALDDMAQQSAGKNAVPLHVEHDLTIPPTGKILRSEVRRRQDGEYELLQEIEYFDNRETISLPNGLEIIRAKSASDNRPFKSRSDGKNTKTIVHLDLANFDSREKLKTFISELESSEEFQFEPMGRHSLSPDALILIQTLPLTYFLGRVTKRVIDKFADDTGDSIVAAIKSIVPLTQKAIKGFFEKSSSSETPVTIIAIPGDPIIEFVIQNPNVDLQGLEEAKIRAASEYARWLDETFSATKIQFEFLENEWKLNYLLSTSGEVLGSLRAVKRQDDRMEQIRLIERRRKNEETLRLICKDVTKQN